MPPRILIVEDNRTIARELEIRLVRLGFAVAGVTAFGEHAIALAAREQPDLVLMDIRLEGEMDGITAAEQIRAARAVPIVFLTGF
ncbi:MAG: response regulator, partial [Kofleriaceae bacterium]